MTSHARHYMPAVVAAFTDKKAPSQKRKRDVVREINDTLAAIDKGIGEVAQDLEDGSLDIGDLCEGERDEVARSRERRRR